MKGGVPLKVPLKRTLALGTADCGSGGLTKLGGSEDRAEQVKGILTVGGGLRDQRTLSDL